MKFSRIVLSTVVLLGIGVIGGSWYTGKQVEARYQQLIALSNQQLTQLGQQYGIKLAIKEVEVARHFFSSEAKYRLEAELDGEKYEFIADDKLYHGPFPLNRLAKLNFMPVLMSMENNLNMPTQLNAILGEKLGSGFANISYSGKLDGEFILSPLKYSDEHHQFKSSPAKLYYGYDINAQHIHGGMSVEQLDFSDVDWSVQLQGVEYVIKQAENAQHYPFLALGNVNIKTQQIALKRVDKEKLVLSSLDMASQNRLQEDRVLSKEKVSIENVHFEGVELGKFNLDLDLDLDAELANAVTSLFSNPEDIQINEVSELLLALLGKSPKVTMHDFSLSSGNGNVTSSLILNLQEFDVKKISDFTSMMKAIQQSKLSLGINREYLEKVGRDVEIHWKGISKTEAENRAKQMTNELFATAGGSRFAVIEGNTVKSELQIEQGKVYLNGREIPEHEIQMALFMLILGIQGF